MTQIIETLTIHSKDRNTGDDLNNFTYTLKKTLKNIQHIIPHFGQIFHSEPTMNKWNDFFSFTDNDSSPYTFNVDNGFYSLQELMDEVIIQMNTAIGTTDIYTNDVLDETKCVFWVEQSARTKRITIKRTTGTFELHFTQTNIINIDSIGATLGFGFIELTGAGTYTAKQLPVLSTRIYEVVSPDLCINRNYSAIRTTESLMTINQLANDGSLNFNETDKTERLQPKQSNLSTFRIKILNDKGKLAQITDDYVIQFKVVCLRG